SIVPPLGACGRPVPALRAVAAPSTATAASRPAPGRNSDKESTTSTAAPAPDAVASRSGCNVVTTVGGKPREHPSSGREAGATQPPDRRPPPRGRLLRPEARPEARGRVRVFRHLGAQGHVRGALVQRGPHR